MKIYKIEGGRTVVTDNQKFIICIRDTERDAIMDAIKIKVAIFPNSIDCLKSPCFVRDV